MMEVKTTGQCGPVITGSGGSSLDLETFTSSISQKRKHIELWLLSNTNGKSQAAYAHYLLSSLVSSNHRKNELGVLPFGPSVNV